MRLLADENVPRVAVEALFNAGHDVVWVALSAPGARDSEVLAQAVRENRIPFTFDKDFGDLARIGTCGVILIRVPLATPTEIATRIVELLAARADWAGHFSVVEPGRIRMRPLHG